MATDRKGQGGKFCCARSPNSSKGKMIWKVSAEQDDTFYFLDWYYNKNPSYAYSYGNMQLPGGMWNCSVPYWADFQQHFLCTLVPECAGGEDKIICPWVAV
nr:hypothetical protein BaRGS_027632 [Batillaria attramentaria]